ncbi:transcriptional regulator [Pseudomonas sp. BN606]|uniref:helix-turn-helix domain-containing transcriptional regulator n=1 Tax=Pseudomonas sp. BN606 TaxID=2567894 RepID=UPI0024559024|nr:transcriptional regulator [Pseudomonas sp. BN606]MDH4651397.1 transcriptional regulator [Pseudomonas sp. BN606]
MALTRDQARLERASRDPAFSRALLAEAGFLFLQGETAAARLTLRDLIDATLGFEGLAVATGKPSKSLRRMLSARGNPGMDSLSSIFAALTKSLDATLQARSFRAQ